MESRSMPSDASLIKLNLEQQALKASAWLTWQCPDAEVSPMQRGLQRDVCLRWTASQSILHPHVRAGIQDDGA